jgi:hypothetical protein
MELFRTLSNGNLYSNRLVFILKPNETVGWLIIEGEPDTSAHEAVKFQVVCDRSDLVPDFFPRAFSNSVIPKFLT